jgi:hypothetical protein
MMKAEPQREHRWLERLVGEWTYEGVTPGESGKQPERSTGTETVRSIGGIWFIAEGQGEMPGGGPATSVMTLGFDPQKKRYVGTWIGSMMTHLWVYEGGELDAAERTLTLNATGPSMTGDGRTMQYKDVIELRSDDHRVLTGWVLGDDEKWQQLMAAEYRRKK